MKKTRIAWVALITALGFLTSCASGKENSPSSSESQTADLYTDPGTFPITNEPVTLNLFSPLLSHIVDLNTNDVTLYFEELMGINLEFETIPEDSAREKVNLMMTSGDIPDVFMMGQSGAVPDENRFGVEEGLLLDLTELIDTKMTEFPKILSEVDGLRERITAVDGKIYSLPRYNDAYHVTLSNKMWVNTMWIEKMGVEIPTTTEEFYEVCKKYMEMNPNGIALAGGMGWNGNPIPFFMNAFTYHPAYSNDYGLTVQSGVVQASMNTEKYREGLRYMNQLYRDGLLYEGAFTMSVEQMKTLVASEGEPVLFIAGGASVNWIDSVGSAELYGHYYPIAPLVGPEGTQYVTYSPTVTGAVPSYAITNECKYPEAAIRFADYLFTLDGTLTVNSGIKGEGWDDPLPGELGLTGDPALYRKLRPYTHEPKNYNWQDFGVAYASNTFRFGEATEQNVDIMSAEGLEKMLYQATHDLYEPYKQTEIQSLPNVKLLADEQQSIQTIGVEINKYYTESEVAFIIGALNLDTDWDTYVQGLEDMGLSKILETYQKGYDRQYK